VPADREGLQEVLATCAARISGAPVDLHRIPADCPLLDLEEHGLSLDSIQLLELVVLLEEHLGRDLELAEVADDWTTYTWGRLLDDLIAAIDDDR